MLKIFLIGCRIIFCDFFAVDNRRAYKRHIVMITLYVLFSAVCIAEAGPSTLEKYLFVPREEGVKLFNSNLHFGEGGAKNSIKVINILRPIGCERVETGEDVEDVGIKFCGSSGKAGDTIPCIGEAVINKNNGQSTSNAEEPQVAGSEYEAEKVHPSIYIWVGLIIWFLLFDRIFSDNF